MKTGLTTRAFANAIASGRGSVPAVGVARARRCCRGSGIAAWGSESGDGASEWGRIHEGADRPWTRGRPSGVVGSTVPIGKGPKTVVGTKGPSGTIPKPVVGAKRPFGTIPKPVVGAKRPFGTFPKPIVGTNMAFGTFPKPVVGTNRPFGIFPKPLVGTKTRSGAVFPLQPVIHQPFALKTRSLTWKPPASTRPSFRAHLSDPVDPVNPV